MWGWRGAARSEAPAPRMLPAPELCGQKTFPRLHSRGCFVPRIIAALSCWLWSLREDELDRGDSFLQQGGIRRALGFP